MNVEPMYLTIFLIAGGIIFLVLFFHYDIIRNFPAM